MGLGRVAIAAAEALDELSKPGATSSGTAARALCLSEQVFITGILGTASACCCCGVLVGLQLSSFLGWLRRRLDWAWLPLADRVLGRSARPAELFGSHVVSVLHNYKKQELVVHGLHVPGLALP